MHFLKFRDISEMVLKNPHPHIIAKPCILLLKRYMQLGGEKHILSVCVTVIGVIFYSMEHTQ
jgi:hypothetical protein